MPPTSSNSSSSISPLAQVHQQAIIGNNVTISPFCYIDQDVVIGDNTWIAPNVTIFAGARIGKDCRIFSGAVIAAVPQDLKFGGEQTTVEIGDHTTIRECATIHRGTTDAYKTTVGSHCLLMAYTHVAHDCKVGNHVIMANGVQLAGHVTICDHAILEGSVLVQQFVTIGAHTFIAGGSLVRKSVPPYVKAGREPLSYIGINKVGLERRGFDKDTISHINNIYRHLFVNNKLVHKGIRAIKEQEPDTPYRTEIIDFVLNAKDGIMKGFNALDEQKTPVTLPAVNGVASGALLNE